jgi:hypothetical protein
MTPLPLTFLRLKTEILSRYTKRRAQADSRVMMLAEWRVGNDPNESIHRTGDTGELTGRIPGFCGLVC